MNAIAGMCNAHHGPPLDRCDASEVPGCGQVLWAKPLASGVGTLVAWAPLLLTLVWVAHAASFKHSRMLNGRIINFDKYISKDAYCDAEPWQMQPLARLAVPPQWQGQWQERGPRYKELTRFSIKAAT